MEELFEIAKSLNELYQQRVEVTVILAGFQQELDGRKSLIVPVVIENERIVGAGWSGKNEAERNALRDAVYARDEKIVGAQNEINALRGKLAEIDARIAGADADRRAIEWAIRAKQVNYTAPKADDPTEDPLDVELQGDVDKTFDVESFDDETPLADMFPDYGTETLPTPYDIDDVMF